MPIIKDGFFYCDCGNKLGPVLGELPEVANFASYCKKCKKPIPVEKPKINKKVPVPKCQCR